MEIQLKLPYENRVPLDLKEQCPGQNEAETVMIKYQVEPNAGLAMTEHQPEQNRADVI